MLAREVRAPVDLVFGIQTDQPPASYDDYSTAMAERKKLAYSLVRQYLEAVAQRMKR